jgi:nicotinamide-nucleotide amidase
MRRSQTEDKPVTTLESHIGGKMPSTMNAEIIAVGTELLMGEVINSNAAWLSEQLAAIGVNVYFHTAVGDNPQRIRDIFQRALGRSNLLLVTGGLGPTDDDLTVATLAGMLDTPMISDPDSEKKIREFFITRDMPMSNTNLKQAQRPVDAEVLFNRMGTAPGVYWDVTQKVAERGWGTGPKIIMAFPGVPREMKVMWSEEALTRLMPMLPEQSVLVTRFLKFIGLGESMLAEKLRDLMAMESPTVSPYVGQAEVKIRIAVRAENEATALAQIEPVEREIMARVGEYCFGKDDEQLEAVVGDILREKGLTLSVSESCTGGLVSSRLTDVSGSSEYITLNTVTYSNEAKTQLLGVSPEMLAAHGAVSEEVAAEMVRGILKLANTDIGLSITGIAGPTGETPEKSVGLAYIGLIRQGSEPVVKKVSVNPNYSRDYIKYWFSQYALNYTRQFLEGHLQG